MIQFNGEMTSLDKSDEIISSITTFVLITLILGYFQIANSFGTAINWYVK